MTPEQIVAAARALIGTPYAHQGRLPGIALDCVGVAVTICRQQMMNPTLDVTGYPQVGDGKMLMEACDKYLIRIQEIEVGGVAIFSSGGPVHHMGIVAPYQYGGLSFIHARGPLHPRKVVETKIIGTMRLCAAYRFPGVEC